MSNATKVNLSRQEIIGTFKAMKEQDRDAFLEDLLATTSPKYLESIKEARALQGRPGKTPRRGIRALSYQLIEDEFLHQ